MFRRNQQIFPPVDYAFLHHIAVGGVYGNAHFRRDNLKAFAVNQVGGIENRAGAEVVAAGALKRFQTFPGRPAAVQNLADFARRQSRRLRIPALPALLHAFAKLLVEGLQQIIAALLPQRLPENIMERLPLFCRGHERHFRVKHGVDQFLM